MRQVGFALVAVLGIQFLFTNYSSAQIHERMFWNRDTFQSSDAVEQVGTQQNQMQVIPTQSTIQQAAVKPLQNFSYGSLNFYDAFKRRSPHQTRRGRRHLVQWPTQKVGTQTRLACGSEHIRDYRSKAYMHPTSACMLAGAAQEWRRTMCPQNTPDCQLMFGDMTYGNKRPRSWPHRSHKQGHCVDVWPIRKPGKKGEVNRFSAAYDRARTKKLIEIFLKWGSDNSHRGRRQIFFNDPSIRKVGLTRYFRNHDDHIHVCFRPTRENKKKCQQTRFDPLVCPELSTPQQYQQQMEFVESLGDTPASA